MFDANIIKDIQHERTIASTHFVDEEIVVGIQTQFVVGHHVSSHCFTIIRLEEFRGCVPELSSLIWPFFIQLIFELGVTVSEKLVEFGFISNCAEVERLAR